MNQLSIYLRDLRSHGLYVRRRARAAFHCVVTILALASLTVGTPASAAEALLVTQGWQSPEELAKSSNPALKKLAAEITSKSIAIARINPALITEKRDDMRLDLESGVSLTFNKTGFETTARGSSIWRGEVRNGTQPKKSKEFRLPNAVFLAKRADNVVGSVHVDDELYQIVPLGKGEHAIVKVDVSKLSEGDDTLPVPESEALHDPMPEVVNARGDGVSVIRALVVVPNNAAADLPVDLYLVVDALIAESNQGYINSDVPIRLESAGILRVNYNEIDGGADSWSPLLKKLRTVDDEELGAPVHGMREALSADVVVMMVDMSGYGGLAYMTAKKSSAYGLLKTTNSRLGYYTFAHEIGHNIGAAHNPENASSDPAYPYAYGYRQETSTPRWRTIMSYECPLKKCPRENYWSNPRKTLNGLPMGTVEKNDAARALTERGPLVAGFYPTPPANVMDGANMLEVPGQQVTTGK